MSDQMASHALQILVADDENVIRSGLKFIITQRFHDIEVLEASNGLMCWDMLQAHPQIPLMFVDIRMPGMDGLRICEKVKTEGLPTRTVIVSGFRDFEYARHALGYGVTDYLLKPVNPSDVLRLINELLGQDITEAEQAHDKNERLIIEHLRTWIHDHLHSEITLTDLSERFHYSASYLSALFKKETGKGFLEYLVDCRMQRAKHLLLDPSLRIADIARQVGYTNAKAFSMAFRKAYSITPTAYREKRKISTTRNS
jgi:two-component system response regulator YesN